ncbi:MAG: helicase-related protein [Promethearchaeota archaeon]
MILTNQNLEKGANDSFEVGEVVEARGRLWRIDRKSKIRKNIKGIEKEFYIYKVSSITGQPSTQILIPYIEKVKKSILPPPTSKIIGNPRYQKLLLDAIKLDLIYGTNSFISLQNSKVIPISYQLVPVLMALNLENVRLLLADDVGLGKTVEAGLILQELMGRKRVNRVLIVVPANLREQWQEILRRFFGIDAVIMSRRNRRILESELMVGGNPWGYYNVIITSIDYAKQPGIKEEIIQFEWDMIIIDEAHNVMRPHLGSENERSKTFKKSYGFAKILAEKYPHLLLLTATPHNGYRDCFASLLEMLDKDIISINKNKEYIINREKAIYHICQRRRSDVIEWIKNSKLNRNPFPIRDSEEIYITPSQEFKDTIKALNVFSDYVLNRTKNISSSEKRKLSIWTILHFHKRAISSPHALICSINNRIDEIDKKMQKNYQDIQNLESYLSSQEAAQSVIDGYETDRLTEEEIDVRTDKVIIESTLENLQKEKNLLIETKKLAEKLKQNDSKLIQLLDNILPRRFKDSKKIIIFTRYIDTLNYLKENLEKKKQTTLKYNDIDIFAVHGQISAPLRQDIYNKFLESQKGILISTDCMAEGIDLQFSANQIINYELTWNPNRLEQRNGRIDRFGQPKEKVYIRTLIMKNTIELDILETLVKKAYEIKNAYGFVPGFFGDPESVIDHLREKRTKKKTKDIQSTLDKYLDFSKEIDDLFSVFFSEQKVKDMLEDSFYGHTNIDLQEIEERMIITEQNIGNEKTLLEFLKAAIELYEGNIKQKQNHSEIYEITLPEKVQEDIGITIKDSYLITPNRELNATHHNIEGLNLKNPLVAGLIEKVKYEAFSDKNKFYGRTAAFSSYKTKILMAIIHIKIRYVVNTEPKTLMEEIAKFGVDIFERKLIEENIVNDIWNSEWKNHNKKDIEIKKHLEKTLKMPELNDFIKQITQKRLKDLIRQRKETIDKLKKQGAATDLKGIDDINAVGSDLLTITLIYPELKGGK